MMNSIPKHLVLLGGGHSHVIVLKQWGLHPLAGVRVTLISDGRYTPYSGMLPGYVAGQYGYGDCHIDLEALTAWAGVEWVRSRAVGLDGVGNRVLLEEGGAIGFDRLSIDIGITPAVATVQGAAEYAIPVKPISQFLSYWDQLVGTVNPERPVTLAIVGGGAGGVELALAVQARLGKMVADGNLTVHLLHRGDRLMPERHSGFSRRVEGLLRRRGIQVHLGETVQRVTAEAVRCESGLMVECDRVLWVTQAAAATWLSESGLATTERGFIAVDETLRSSHPQIFAAGDVATMVRHPRPKAGVFAVRQGLPLWENLQRSLQDQPLKPFVPQKEFLVLLGTGDGKAMASRGRFHLGAHPVIWQWKDWIDRRFMAQFCGLGELGDR